MRPSQAALGTALGRSAPRPDRFAADRAERGRERSNRLPAGAADNAERRVWQWTVARGARRGNDDRKDSIGQRPNTSDRLPEPRPSVGVHVLERSTHGASALGCSKRRNSCLHETHYLARCDFSHAVDRRGFFSAAGFPATAFSVTVSPFWSVKVNGSMT